MCTLESCQLHRHQHEESEPAREGPESHYICRKSPPAVRELSDHALLNSDGFEKTLKDLRRVEDHQLYLLKLGTSLV